MEEDKMAPTRLAYRWDYDNDNLEKMEVFKGGLSNSQHYMGSSPKQTFSIINY